MEIFIKEGLRMHVIIITDLEGISCVDSIDMIIPFGSELNKKACEYLMHDTNAAIDGAFLGGATKVTVVDGHGGANNFIMDRLDKRATYINAREFIDANPKDFSYDALMCVGAHAMAGTVGAFLDHTQSSTEWFEYKINGIPCGEMAQQAYTLGVAGTPLVMMSGDTAACQEAKEMFPCVVCAEVKHATIRNMAECLPLEESLEIIRNAAKQGVEKAKEIKPTIISLPAEITVTFTRNDYCDFRFKEGITQRNGRTLTKTIKEISCYRDLGF